MKYKVTIMFESETGRIHRKEFNWKTGSISESVYELFRWAEKFGAQKIIFTKKEK